MPRNLTFVIIETVFLPVLFDSIPPTSKVGRKVDEADATKEDKWLKTFSAGVVKIFPPEMDATKNKNANYGLSDCFHNMNISCVLESRR